MLTTRPRHLHYALFLVPTLALLVGSHSQAQSLTATPNPSTPGSAITLSVESCGGPHAPLVQMSFYYGTSKSEINSLIVTKWEAIGDTTATWTPPGPGTYYLQAIVLPTPAYCGDGFASYITTQVVQPDTSVFDPLYEVESILYSPPGNQSSQGYGMTTTTGTTTSIGSSFTSATDLTFTAGVPDILSASGSIGYSTTSASSSAFTDTWSDATTVATDDNSNPTYNPKGSNAVNHNLDTFEIWLNPQVTVLSNGPTPLSYTVGSQPIAGLDESYAQVLGIPAIAMEAQPGSVSKTHPSGISSVPPGDLNRQAILGLQTSYAPGLASICKNLIVAEYDAGTCTMADQCGCTPADFVAILQTDPLLNYSGTTYSASPYAGSVDPTTLDRTPASTCSSSDIPKNSDCRYVPLGIIKGLSGDESVTFQQSDSTATTLTTIKDDSYSVGLSYTTGTVVPSLRIAKTWTWSNTESDGNTTGQTKSMSTTLKTSTTNCVENVTFYEDTEYNTYAYQAASSVCP